MALFGQIESADRTHSRPVGAGMDTAARHVLSLARADEEREAEDRVLAARAVQRLAGADAAEMLAALGLEAS